MKTYVEFKSDKFPPYEEEEQVNPERWGKRLADFLVSGLRTEGVDVSDPVAEDWGWVIKVANNDFPLWIGCGNYDEYDDGFLCFVEPNRPYVRRFLKKFSTIARARMLVDALESVIASEPSIRDTKWWTAEEFNSP